MKIALLGADGQVGWALQRALAPLGEVLALRRAPAHGLPGADLAQPAQLAEKLREWAPHVIVNAAAYTAVDKAETQPDLAHTVNALAPAALATLAAQSGAWLVHYSTDYVFAGHGDAPHREDDATGPLNTYGHSKLAGEAHIRSSGCHHLILRTSWVHGSRGGNFARTMLRLAAERDRLTVVDDQIGAPTSADLLADVTAHALRQAVLLPALGGTYHAVAGGAVSWHGYARHVLAWAQAHGAVLKAGPDDVHPVASRDYPTPARRPLNSRLDTGKLRRSFGLVLPDWTGGVDRLLSEMLGPR